MKSKLLFIGFGLVILLALFHKFSSFFYIYWTSGWSDYLTHFIGGITLGILALWLCYNSGLFKRRTPSSKETLMLGFLSALVIGIVWEGFEFGTSIIRWSSNYPLDTAGDLVSDVLGGTVAGLYGRNKSLYE